ncbi:MAG TPA: RNA polymerase sigma-70 factor [Agriterribacter sp.]|nr:RNA polymerase sigma-70 factor [Agriterribacter sp.]
MQNVVPYEEEELLALVASGDQNAFAELVDRHWKQVYGHANAYTKDPSLAQEITQDIFLQVWNKKDKLSEINNFKCYLFILGRNLVISAMRKKLVETASKDFIESEDLSLVPDQQLRYKETNSAIVFAIEKLPPTRKIVFKMSRYEGLTYEEIAERLNISKNTVKEHIALSLNFLRNYLHLHGNILPFLFFSITFF